MEKSCRKCTLKASPIPFFNFAKQAKIALARKKFFLKKGILKEDYQKALKKLTLFFFQTQSLLMDKVIKNKRGLELVTSPSSGDETSSEKFLYSLYMI